MVWLSLTDEDGTAIAVNMANVVQISPRDVANARSVLFTIAAQDTSAAGIRVQETVEQILGMLARERTGVAAPWPGG
jgi:hypothetical protein